MELLSKLISIQTKKPNASSKKLSKNYQNLETIFQLILDSYKITKNYPKNINKIRGFVEGIIKSLS